jgi:hypothetical protein
MDRVNNPVIGAGAICSVSMFPAIEMTNDHHPGRTFPRPGLRNTPGPPSGVHIPKSGRERFSRASSKNLSGKVRVIRFATSAFCLFNSVLNMAWCKGKEEKLRLEEEVGMLDNEQDEQRVTQRKSTGGGGVRENQLDQRATEKSGALSRYVPAGGSTGPATGTPPDFYSGERERLLIPNVVE